MSGKVDGEVQMSLAFVQGKELTKVTKHFTIQVKLQTLLTIRSFSKHSKTGRSFLWLRGTPRSWVHVGASPSWENASGRISDDTYFSFMLQTILKLLKVILANWSLHNGKSKDPQSVCIVLMKQGVEENNCKAVTHKMMDDQGEHKLTVYLLHSLPLRMSVVQASFKDIL